MKYYYIYTQAYEALAASVIVYAKHQKIKLIPTNIDKLDDLSIKKDEHIVVSALVDDIKKVMHFASENFLSLGIIPHVDQKELKNTFNFPNTLEEQVDLALTPCLEKLDLLYCNEKLVLQEVVIGEVPPLDSFSSSMEKLSFWERTKSFLSMIKKIKTLTHTSFTISTAKEKVLKFSAIGAVGVEYNNRTFASKLIANYLKFNDSRLSLVILSPSSILEYIGYIFQSHILKRTPNTLPTSVGYVHSHRLEIETQKELSVSIDSVQVLHTPIVLETKTETLALSVGKTFWEKSSPVKEIKESVRVDHLPSDKEMSVYLQKSIPLFSHASYEQFSSLFSNLREESKLNTTFMILLILATMIATFGLYINSASVIIGAMLLAPLMQPIVGVSMGLLRQDITLFIDGAKAVFIGVFAVIFTAVFISLLIPLEQLTSEMNGRLSPTILDMLVAIVSGIAAAYAKSNEKIVGSLAGVAIAVALVPPLAVSGIGLGWADWHMFSSALLLFITNLVGIVLAASLTFLMLGFSPVAVAKKGILYAAVLVGIVSIPLSLSFVQMKDDIHVQKTLSSFTVILNKKEIHLKNIEIQGKEVRCEVIASDILTQNEKLELKNLIVKRVGEELTVFVSFWYAL
ncbi:MAG: Putative integral membrane protein [uncultured Sulfurovum sp.]|uniref:Integral membrane protein n=1 Tax=uncultured Sulfurovum sp. TaxID=269237 RepID=A0A6S6TKH5_9BACT|nr:MAG: Putative integral membrane protein [uncultured Sulfurovum sp.]